MLRTRKGRPQPSVLVVWLLGAQTLVVHLPRFRAGHRHWGRSKWDPAAWAPLFRVWALVKPWSQASTAAGSVSGRLREAPRVWATGY